uniref:EF-hand domain-containing protein n=1 Tax=Zooxanthella nutricula TaxID=1333877 RepID=A0A7S2NJX1_9DINO
MAQAQPSLPRRRCAHIACGGPRLQCGLAHAAMRRSVAAVIAACLLVCASVWPAVALSDEEAQQQVDDMMEETDKDKDGKLTIDEITSTVKAHMEEADAASEFPEFEEKLKKRFPAADVNGDSFLDKSELPAFMKAFTEDDDKEDL